jgi:mannosyl-oligosaccharide glucosidase
MDDYPRAPLLTTEEAHLDLQCWVIISSKTLSRVASVLGKDEDHKHYHMLAGKYRHSLEKNFWDPERQMYDDFYIDENGVKQFEGHTGYLNFWPFFLGEIRTHEERFEITYKKLIAEDSGMLTPYGVRSLSINDSYYRLGDNYWTSPIWMNINYLIIGSLHRYSQDTSINEALRASIKQTYEQLRSGVIEMISSQYAETGFIWEVYDDQTGQGIDNHPFTGWSALYTNLLAEMY